MSTLAELQGLEVDECVEPPYCRSSSMPDTSEADLEKVIPQKREREGLVLAAVGSVSILSFMDN